MAEGAKSNLLCLVKMANRIFALALEKDVPQGRWPLGRILETYPGRDGHSCVTKVQCGDRTLVRPIHKLVPLQH